MQDENKFQVQTWELVSTNDGNQNEAISREACPNPLPSSKAQTSC